MSLISIIPASDDAGMDVFAASLSLYLWLPSIAYAYLEAACTVDHPVQAIQLVIHGTAAPNDLSRREYHTCQTVFHNLLNPHAEFRPGVIDLGETCFLPDLQHLNGPYEGPEQFRRVTPRDWASEITFYGCRAHVLRFNSDTVRVHRGKQCSVITLLHPLSSGDLYVMRLSMPIRDNQSIDWSSSHECDFRPNYFDYPIDALPDLHETGVFSRLSRTKLHLTLKPFIERYLREKTHSASNITSSAALDGKELMRYATSATSDLWLEIPATARLSIPSRVYKNPSDLEPRLESSKGIVPTTTKPFAFFETQLTIADHVRDHWQMESIVPSPVNQMALDPRLEFTISDLKPSLYHILRWYDANLSKLALSLSLTGFILGLAAYVGLSAFVLALMIVLLYHVAGGIWLYHTSRTA